MRSPSGVATGASGTVAVGGMSAATGPSCRSASREPGVRAAAPRAPAPPRVSAGQRGPDLALPWLVLTARGGGSCLPLGEPPVAAVTNDRGLRLRAAQSCYGCPAGQKPEWAKSKALGGPSPFWRV